jgi:hypothetical protein
MLAGPLGQIGGRRPEAALPGLPGEFGLGAPKLGQRVGADFAAKPVLGELLRQTAHAVARATTTHQAFDEALIAQQAFLGQPLEERLERVGIGRVWRKFAGELGTAVLTTREMRQRPRPQRERRAGPPAGQAASSAPPRWLTPKCSRTLFSISRASSGCSRRYSRALSLPCPTRSP